MMSNSIEFTKLPITFYFFTIFAVWCPSDWSPLGKMAYRCYMLSHIISVFVFWPSMLVTIITADINDEFMFENTFAFNALTFGLYKEIYILSHVGQIMDIVKVCFEDDWYEPVDTFERSIAAKYQYETRWITKVYGIGTLVGLFSKALLPTIRRHIEWSLPLQIWYPYRINGYVTYFMGYISQVIGGVPLICMHVAIDSLFVGLILELCTKLEILQRRLKLQYKNIGMENLRLEDSVLKSYIRRHARILELGNRLNSDFYGILTGQLLATIPNLCINIYLLSQQKDLVNFRTLDICISLSACLMQIFFYCWYGNIMIIQSLGMADAVYEINWPSLSVKSKKLLLTVMVRASQKIEFSTATFIMNNDSFIEVLKVAYSAFRLLQTTSS